MKNFGHFLFYNNTVPLIFGVLFLGAGATFAASPDARSAVVSSKQEVTSVDNSYILNTNLSSFPFSATVNSITDDSTSYYVLYTLSTIDLQDGVWQPVAKINTLKVGKDVIGDNDLGTYVSKQLSDIYYAEIRRLKETQQIQKTKGLSKKAVTTIYSGLIGKSLNPRTEEFSGYTPVMKPKPAIPGVLPQNTQPNPNPAFTTTINNTVVNVPPIVDTTPPPPNATSTPQTDPTPTPAPTPEPPTVVQPTPTSVPAPAPVPTEGPATPLP